MDLKKDTINSDSSEKRKKKINLNLWPGVFILLIILIGIGAYYYTNSYKKKVDLIVSEIKIRQEIKSKKLASMQSQIDQYKKSISQIKIELRQEINSYMSNLHKDLKDNKVKKSERFDNSDQVISEISYLLNIGNYSLYFFDDIEKTILILEEVEKKLKSIADTSLYSIRNEVKKKVSELKLLHKDNQKNILSRLDQLYDKTKKLKLINKSVKKVEEPKKFSEKIWNEIKSVISIKKHDQPIKSPVYWKNKDYLYQQIDISEISVIKSDQENYIRSLGNIKEHIKKYFIYDEDIISVISNLEKVKLSSDLPDIRYLSEIFKAQSQRNSYSIQANQ